MTCQLPLTDQLISLLLNFIREWETYMKYNSMKSFGMLGASLSLPYWDDSLIYYNSSFDSPYNLIFPFFFSLWCFHSMKSFFSSLNWRRSIWLRKTCSHHTAHRMLSVTMKDERVDTFLNANYYYYYLYKSTMQTM